jgi:hypothetical protein
MLYTIVRMSIANRNSGRKTEIRNARIFRNQGLSQTSSRSSIFNFDLSICHSVERFGYDL